MSDPARRAVNRPAAAAYLLVMSDFSRLTRSAASLLLAGGLLFVDASRADAQPERRAPSPTQAQAAPPREPAFVDARATREALMDLLQKHPPSVARILKLDPSLMRNEGYLSSYPALKNFLADHPDVQQNAPYYLEQVRIFDGGFEVERTTPRMRLIEGFLAGLTGFTALAIVIGTLVWLVRTTLDQRRWNRLSRIQAEVHSKLMDRFSSNDELLTYVQTPSGKRFLESGPSPLAEAPATVGAPFARIMWSFQIGVVLLALGGGLLFVSQQTFEEARDVFFIGGCLAIALGAGFTVSAAAAYLISKRLGLFDRPAADHA